jgi:ABC-type protease/lipase transport system fused ATPase/permease subunit
MEKNYIQDLSYDNLDTRRKVMVGFAIVSILPLLVSFYLLYDKVLGGSRRVSLFLFIATLLSMMGFFLFIDLLKQALKTQQSQKSY